MMIEKTQITKDEIKELISGKKIAAIDYGKKRIGIAVTDIFHISLNPLKTIENNPENIISDLVKIVKENSIEIIVLGFPLWQIETESSIQTEIKEILSKLKEKLNLPVLLFDESFSSAAGVANMVQSGVKKSKRATKGNIDRFAALNILKNFLAEYEDNYV